MRDSTDSNGFMGSEAAASMSKGSYHCNDTGQGYDRLGPLWPAITDSVSDCYNDEFPSSTSGCIAQDW
ncbi:hypothetical protein GCM10007418_05590 [Halopseudomonas salina]|uniref:Uncharacterized protein n=1 Tax=Halopseudomonas salina TaxID=1323744 RepID=A0ABQ1P118_9GAMM|nr:hypothetical protein GCM10007418_05590 [Halopseudomonas salina]